MPDEKELQNITDRKQVSKAVQEMTLGELEDFVREHGDAIGVEVTRTETFNTRYAAMPRAQIVSTPTEENQ
jgi:hypothetical protein